MQTDREARGEKPWRECEKVIREGETTQREGEHRRERPGDGQTNKTGEGRKVEWRDEKSKQEYNTKQIRRRKSGLLRESNLRKFGGNPCSEHFWQTAHARLSPAVQHCNTPYASVIY